MQAIPKWRPTLGMITAALIAAVILLPLVSLLFFRLYEDQLIHQAEGEVIAQAAMISAAYERVIAEAPEGAFPVGPARPAHDDAIAPDERYAPIAPSLDLATSPILPARPDADLAPVPATPEALSAGEALTSLAMETQRTTLAGYRLMDANGVVIAGREDIGMSFADLPEVQAAMHGRFQAVLRVRDEQMEAPPLYSISRGTSVRVFVAMPVFVDGRVRGVAYISRTPDNILRQLFQERGKVAVAAILVLIASAAIGAAFVRIVARPIRDLARRADEIARGRREAIGPLSHHGTQELASLSQNFMIMAKRLSDRSDYLSTFASHVSHELKTPLTSIRGAAELMRDADASMTPEERARFLSNMLADAERMIVLLDRLRDLARADNPALGGSTTLDVIEPVLQRNFAELDVALVTRDAPSVAMSQENALIVFGHLLDNAARHGAKRVEIEATQAEGFLDVHVRDDGSGVSPGNRERIFDAFFTTRRAEGGTGMGLGIVSALIRAHGGTIALEDSAQGASFVLHLPTEEGPPPQPAGWRAMFASVWGSVRGRAARLLRVNP